MYLLYELFLKQRVSERVKWILFCLSCRAERILNDEKQVWNMFCEYTGDVSWFENSLRDVSAFLRGNKYFQVLIIKWNGLFCQFPVWYQLWEIFKVIILVRNGTEVLKKVLWCFHGKGNDAESLSWAHESCLLSMQKDFRGRNYLAFL